MKVDKSRNRPGRGRPRSFRPEQALDHAAALFWRHGYDGVDVDSIAAAVGVTKPSLYRLFGDKEGLFLAALARYGETLGAAPVRALMGAPAIRDAVTGFVDAAIDGATHPDRPSGCLMACVAAQSAGSVPKVRDVYAAGLAAMADAIAARFARATVDGELPRGFPAQVRARLLIDLMQAMALRARSGSGGDELRHYIRPYVDLVLA